MQINPVLFWGALNPVGWFCCGITPRRKLILWEGDSCRELRAIKKVWDKCDGCGPGKEYCHGEAIKMAKIKRKIVEIDEEKLKAKVKRLFFESVPRYYHHTISVVENMKKLIKGMDDPEDKIILIVTAYLHDIGYSEAHGGDYVGNIKEQEIKIRLHSEKGAKVAKKILREMGMRKETIQEVVYLVSVHHREEIADRRLKFLLEADRGCLCGK